MRYVTYDADGKLTGCYLQDVLAEHEAAHCEISDDKAVNWPAYRMNAERDAIELAPIVTPEPVVPPEVSRRRGLQALLLAGHDEADIEEQIVAHITDSLQQKLALIEFRTSQTFERDRTLVNQIGAVMGLDLDTLFITAAALP